MQWARKWQLIYAQFAIFFVKTADKKIHLPKPLIYCIFNDAPIHGAKHRGACPCENNPLAANYRK